jgi:hypothetical protein
VLRRSGPGVSRGYSLAEFRDACVEVFIHGIAAR